MVLGRHFENRESHVQENKCRHIQNPKPIR